MTIQKCDHCGAECEPGSVTRFDSDHHLTLRSLKTDIEVEFVLNIYPAGVTRAAGDRRVSRDLCPGCQLLIARELVALLERKAPKR